MSLIGNILWIVFGGGIVICLEYLLGGLLLCLTVVGIPFGLKCFEIGIVSLVPFGKTIMRSGPDDSCLSIGLNVIWFVFAGLWIGLTHLLFAIGCAITVIGIPFAIQHVKLAEISLAPFGKTLA